MSKIDIRLLYAGEFGYGLEHANHIADSGDKEYVEWLEEEFEKALSVGEATLLAYEKHTQLATKVAGTENML